MGGNARAAAVGETPEIFCRKCPGGPLQNPLQEPNGSPPDAPCPVPARANAWESQKPLESLLEGSLRRPFQGIGSHHYLRDPPLSEVQLGDPIGEQLSWGSIEVVVR